MNRRTSPSTSRDASPQRNPLGRPRRPARAATAGAVVLGLGVLSACTPDPVDVDTAAAGGGVEAGERFDFSPEQAGRVRAQTDPQAAALVPESVSEDGRLTVAANPAAVPLGFAATDQQTVVGSEVDIAQLMADKLGLELEVQATSWENWPLRLETGQIETVMINVGLTEPRLELYDFATYRTAYMGFEARRDSRLRVEGPEDISGLQVSVSPGTNQDRILLEWNRRLEEQGREPAQLSYYLNDADAVLALVSGRIDLYLGPYPSGSFREDSGSDTRIVGRISAGWPNSTLVAAPTDKGSGLAPALEAALDSAMRDGTYDEALRRWGLEDEELEDSRTVTDAAQMRQALAET